MGGYGSTRWGWHHKKQTVDASWPLIADKLVRDRILKPGVIWGGRLVWSVVATGEECGAVTYYYDTTDMARPWLRLSYTVNETERIDYRVQLTTTPLHYGGVRWWFICPLTTNGRACGRRVGKLYLPPGGRYFGCRHCHDLTYTSCQESDKRVSALRRLDPMALLDALKQGEVDTLMGLKALRTI